MAISAADQLERPISLLQVQAWEVANAAYMVPNGEAYRAYARELYEEDLHERILALFARLDDQNAQVEAALRVRGAAAEQTVAGTVKEITAVVSEEPCEERKVSGDTEE